MTRYWKGAALLVMLFLAASWWAVRPAILHIAEPALQQAADNNINGTLTWQSLKLTSSLDFQLMQAELKDSGGGDVFKAPQITARWSLWALIQALLSGQNPAAAITSVEVRSPSLYFIQKSSSEWNIYSILKKNTEKEPITFRGTVTVSGGDASVQTHAGYTYQFSNLDGQLKWSRDDSIKTSLTGQFFDAPFQIEGTYRSEANFYGTVDADRLQADNLEEFISQLREDRNFEISGGEIRHLRAQIWNQSGSMSYHVTGKAENMEGRYESYKAEDTSAYFNVYSGYAEISQLKTSINGQPVTGDFSFSWSGVPSVNGTFVLHEIRLEQLIPQAETAGRISGKIQVSGPAADPQITGSLTMADGSVGQVPVQSAAADFLWKSGLLTVSRADIETADGSASGYGRWNSTDGTWEADISAHHILLDALPLPAAASGAVSGHIRAAGSAGTAGVTLSRAQGTIEGSGLSSEGLSAGYLRARIDGNNQNGWHTSFYADHALLRGIPVDTLSGEAEGSGDMWTVPYLNGTVGSGAFSLRGSYRAGILDGEAQAGQIPLESFSEISGLPMKGIISFKVSVQGTAEHPVIQGRADGTDGFIGTMPFDTVSVNFRSDGNTLYLEPLLWKKGQGFHRISGSIGLSGGHELRLTADTETMRIEDLAAMAGADLPLTGWISNSMTVSGTLTAPKVSGELHAWDGSAGGQLFQNAAARYRLDGRKLIIDNSLVYFHEGTVHVSGTASEESLDLDADLVDMNIGRILSKSPVEGTATMRGHVSGSLSNPSFNGRFVSRAITYNQSRFRELSGEIHYADGNAYIENASFLQGNGEFKWNGGIRIADQSLNGTLTFEHWNIPSALRFFSVPLQQITGEMSGTMDISGTVGNPDLALQVRIEKGALGQTLMGEGALNLTYRGGNLSLKELRIPVGEGLMAARGTIDKDGAVNMDAGTQNLDMSWIPEVTGQKGLRIGGQLTSAVSIRGTVQSPEADISVSVENPSYGDFVFDSLYVMANVKNRTVSVSQALLSKGIYKASLYGTMPVNMVTRQNTPGAAPLNLKLNLDNADLDTVALFYAPVTSASGPMKGSLQITGAWNDPQINGTVGVAQGTMTFTGLTGPLSDFQASAVFQGDHMEFAAQGNLGGGTVSAKGNTQWKTSALTAYNGELHMHMPSLNASLYKGALDVDLALQDQNSLPKISGTVNVHQAVVDVPYSMTVGGSGMPLLLDINVNVGDSVRLYNKFLYDMVIKGNIHAGGSTESPDMSGKVEAVQGQIKYLYNEFDVERAEAVWGGIDGSFLPILHVLASARVGHYNIGMELDGPPDGLSFELRSDPQLTDQQIMLLLTLKQDPSGSGNDNVQGALFNAGLQLAFSGSLENVLQNTFGLDMVSMTSSLTDTYQAADSTDNQNFYYIKIGKYLFRDFMITATTGVNNSQKSIGFRYDLNSRIGISAWYNSEHDSYIGADWKFTF